MHDDAVGRGEARSNNASSSSGSNSSLTPLLRGLVATVQGAVDAALAQDEGVLESTLHAAALSPGSSSISSISEEATRRQQTRLAGRRKKHTQRQMEHMSANTHFGGDGFADNNTNNMNNANAAVCAGGVMDPKRYSVYIGLVFALAMVFKLVNKFDSKADQVNLMYLLQRLRDGDHTCFKDLSREDLRAFLEAHLCVTFQQQRWHRFDALCQRFDPDKKGQIRHAEVQRSFRWLCPLAEPLGDIFDGQVAAQALLSMVALQALSYELELNVLFRKVLIKHKSIVPSFENFIEQKSTFPNHPPHDARFSCDSLLMADFLFVLASQYLGLECDRSQFAASANRHSYSGKTWRLPGSTPTSSGQRAGPGLSRKQSARRAEEAALMDELLQDATAPPGGDTAGGTSTRAAPLSLLHGVKFAVLNLREACDTLARALLLYDYSSLPLSSSGGVQVEGGR